MKSYYTAKTGKFRKLLVIDGNNKFRMADGTPAFQFMRYNGKPTGAMYGCISHIIRDIELVQPDEVCIAFDGFAAKTEKRKIWAGYKSNRAMNMDDPLYQQMMETIKILKHAGLCVLHKHKADADDIMGAMARVPGRSVIIDSSDKDCFQELCDNVAQMRHIDGQKQFWYADTVLQTFGVPPAQFADYLALVGDSIDTIPGLMGCGPVGAVKLLKQFGSVEGICKRYRELPKGKLRAQIHKQRKDLLLFKQLTKFDTTVISDIAMKGIIPRLTPQPYNKEALFLLLDQYGQKAHKEWFKQHPRGVLSKPPTMFD